MSERDGKYRINAVADQTGISPTTLRAWERRYGLPHPGRSDSAYRIYSDRDIAMVRRVRELCDEGMAPSQAAKVVLEEADQWSEPQPVSDDPYERVKTEIVSAVAAFDSRRTEARVRQALSMGPATSITDRVLIPAMRDIGQMWHDGEITIGEEHMATRIFGDAVAGMLRLIERPDAERTVLLACFADELHVLPADGVAIHLASWGHRVVRLGPRTPPSAIGHAVERLEPNLVALSVTLSPPPDRARELVEGYAKACGDTPWIVGGFAALSLAELVEKQGGHILAPEDVGRLRGEIEKLMSRRNKRSASKS